jgi:hypothetical protein
LNFPIDRGTAVSAGSYPRIFPVRGPITFATGFAWNNRIAAGFAAKARQFAADVAHDSKFAELGRVPLLLRSCSTRSGALT